jgi:DNA-directed RNA polymerase specialized sigma24 family protein
MGIVTQSGDFLRFEVVGKMLFESSSLIHRGGAMKLEQGSLMDKQAQFQTTRWSVIIVAAQDDTGAGQVAAAKLCQLYWYPLYAFARRRNYSLHDAQDLTQGFFLELLENRIFARADQLKGKFRSFLLACFQNYLSVEGRRARSLKRGGDREFVFLDMATAESRYELELADQLTAEKIFDSRWAVTLLSEAMTRLREQYEVQGKILIFESLKAFIDPANSREPLSYEGAASALGVSLGAAKTLICRFRKQYSFLVRQEVSRTVSDPREVDDEIHALCEALIAAEGRC